MASAIDPTKPTDGVPSVKLDLRTNLQAAKTEIEALQTGKADLGHQHVVGDITDAGALAALDEISTAELADDTADTVLGFNGAGNATNIVGQDGVEITGGVIRLSDPTVTAVDTSAYTLTAGDSDRVNAVVMVDAGATNVTLTMPDDIAVSVPGTRWIILKGPSHTGAVTVARETNGTIDGGTSVNLSVVARASAELIVTSNSGSAPVARVEGEIDGDRALAGNLAATGYTISGNLAGTGTISGTLPASASGKVLRTTGNVAIPQTAGFNATLIAGGAHTVTFGATSSSAMAAGDIMSLVVDDVPAIHAVLTASAAKVAFS